MQMFKLNAQFFAEVKADKELAESRLAWLKANWGSKKEINRLEKVVENCETILAAE